MKTIYLARHGEAVSVGHEGVQHDFDRHLSERGRALLQRQAEAFPRLESRIEACYSSPLLRTRQTAEILGRPFGAEVQATEALGSRPAFSEVLKLLEKSSAQTILLVTHQPFVVELCAWLVSGERHFLTTYSTGTVACLRLFQLTPAPRGELVWMMPAEIMASLAFN